ncbi:MAG: DUF4153 domain-containing protein [Thermacetogeniaceae bacterium]
MSRFTETITQTAQRLYQAVSRFPLTVICLVCTSILLCYMISLHKAPELVIQKLMYTFWLGSFLGVAAQFLCERFKRLLKMRLIVYAISSLLIVSYYLILWPAPTISFQVSIRTLVAVFAMFCAFIWVPSYRSSSDFNSIALIHFKSAFTSVLYSAVLSAGCASIIAAVDTLLFSVNRDAYSYMLTIVWVLFATLYYLSMLPRFNAEEDADREYTLQAAQYPRFLEILVSYIAVPLVAAYTLVLTAYFIKILVTLQWPSGQLGGMVLAYSAAGLIIYVLASPLANHFSALYRMIFPKVLIPVVIMQLISVSIRLNAYGVTEPRYYITLFGIFSIVCGIALSFRPVSRNGLIAILAAGFAIFSIIPPVDAFTVSRNSQISRLESMLQSEGVLVNGKLSPKADVSTTLKLESTNILDYLFNRGYIKYIHWLPADFKPYDQMKNAFGFDQVYAGAIVNNNFYANMDIQQPVNIQGYDMLVNANSDRGMTRAGQQPAIDFEVRGIKYKLILDRLSPQEVRVSIRNAAGIELVGTGLYDFATSLSGASNRPKEALSPEAVSLKVEKDGYKLLIMLQNVNITYGGTDAGADYNLFIMFGAPTS